jgi:hypothetical protein
MDLITMDDIDTPCAAISNDECVNCDTARAVWSKNLLKFNETPLQLIFDRKNATAAETNEFLQQASADCNIPLLTQHELQQMQPAPLRKISSLDVVTFNREIMRVYQRVKTELPTKKKLIKPYMQAFLRFVKLPSKWNKIIKTQPSLTEELLIRKMKDDVMEIINQYKLNCRLIHHPRDLPAGVAYYVTNVLEGNAKHFSQSIRRLITSQACIEATIEAATELVLTEDSRKISLFEKNRSRKKLTEESRKISRRKKLVEKN